MQDRKIQNFLRTYPRVFVEGLFNWLLESTSKKSERYNPAWAEVSDFLVPTLHKSLGDGMMLIWEVPNRLCLEQQREISDGIFAIIGRFRDRFHYHFRDLTPVELDAFSEAVLELDLGFGVAKGHAWKLIGMHGEADYAGSVINLAARLQVHARPGGRVVQCDVAPDLLYKLAAAGHGNIVKINGIRGLIGSVKAWVGGDIDLSQEGFFVCKEPTHECC
jgi:class 3 adenylate cyclase